MRKVDTHVHHSAAMNAKHLLRFIKKKCKYNYDEVVEVEKDGTELRLRDVFARLSIEPYDLSIDKLAVMADGGTFQRFDKFNLKYNPCGDSLLRTVFLKTDNHLGGRYLAELTKELLDDLEETKYQLAEYRLSIYGRKPTEWSRLAKWVIGHGLVSEYNRWMCAPPRPAVPQSIALCAVPAQKSPAAARLATSDGRPCAIPEPDCVWAATH